jgi:endo-1,4-beta-xylanase
VQRRAGSPARPSPTRREALALALAATTGAALAAPAGQEGLGTIAARAGILFGAAIAESALTDPAYGDLYRRETRIVTTENALKFDFLRPGPGPIQFAPADRLVDFATQAGLAIRGSALIWNDNAPPWLRAMSGREIERLLEPHIEAVLGRYAGRMHSWDVVNEPFWPGHNEVGGFRRGPWLSAMGPDYIIRAFKRAGQTDSRARLVLNEALTERGDALGRQVRQLLLTLVDRIQDAGAPLHAVGLESHVQPRYGFDPGAFGQFLDDIARRGLDIYITELDIDDHLMPAAIPARDEAVAGHYRAYLEIVLAQPRVKVVQSWGLADPFSWYQDAAVMKELGSSRPARPLLFDGALARKPAWQAVADAFARRRISGAAQP